MLKVISYYVNFNFQDVIIKVQIPETEGFKERIFEKSDTPFQTPVVIDPLVINTTNNVTKSTVCMENIKQMLKIATNTLWSDCTCSLHREGISAYPKYTEGKLVFCDKKHSLLSSLFAAVVAYKQFNEKVADFHTI